MRLDAILDKTTLSLLAVDLVLLVLSGFPEAVKDIVLVCGNDELLGGQTHALGEVSGKDVTEVARRHDESDGRGGEERLGFDEIEVRVEVVCDLGKDTGPVDGVDRSEAVGRVDLGISEESLDEVLPNC